MKAWGSILCRTHFLVWYPLIRITWGTLKKEKHVSCWSQMDQIRIWSGSETTECIVNQALQVILTCNKVGERAAWGMVREVEHG